MKIIKKSSVNVSLQRRQRGSEKGSEKEREQKNSDRRDEERKVFFFSDPESPRQINCRFLRNKKKIVIKNIFLNEMVHYPRKKNSKKIAEKNCLF